LSAINDPAGTIMFADTRTNVFEIQWENTTPTIAGAAGQRNLAQVFERHLDTVVVAFVDGHVKSMKLEALAKPNAAGLLPMFTIEED
jgi:prepilin-type processing-associated H-X9-DG protein